ncbi:MAG: bestrophin family ion channel [Pirellulales bacterium]
MFDRLLKPLPMGAIVAEWVLGMTLYTTIVAWLLYRFEIELVDMAAEMTLLNGLILGLLLVFRNNTAYDRWWEGRKLWGQLVNDSRNLSLKAMSVASPEERRQLARLLGGFANALRLHLRGPTKLADVPGFGQEAAKPIHVPLYLAGQVQALADEWRVSGRIEAALTPVFDVHIRGLMDVCGACERIHTTPLAKSYVALLRHGIAIYAVAAPWFVAWDIGFWSIPVSALMFYYIFGVELLAEELEDPFGTGPDDLDLDRYCRTIENSVNQVLLTDQPATAIRA